MEDAGMPAASRMGDALRAFMLERDSGNFKTSDLEQNLFYESAQQLLDDREPEVFLPVELGGEVWMLVVLEDAAYLHGVKGDVAEIRSFGQLKGDYREAIKAVDGELELTLEFTDKRLPGEVLEVSMKESSAFAAHLSPSTVARNDAIKQLRKKLREWASKSE